MARLKLLWPTGKRAEIKAAFSGRTWGAMQWVAHREGWRRIREMVTSPDELREAIRKRAREDGIPLAKPRVAS